MEIELLHKWGFKQPEQDSTAWFILVQPTCGFNEQQIIGWQGGKMVIFGMSF